MKIKNIIPIIAILTLALLLGACGRSKSTPAPEPTAEETAAPVAEEETATPAAEDESAPPEEEAATESNPVHDLIQQIVDPTMQSIPGAFGPAPGAVIRLDASGEQLVEVAGFASVEDETPVQADDHFEIGSNSKMFTAVLLTQLEEEGVLSIDNSLSTWLPDWAEKIPNGDQMTLRQLANHTSGLWDYGDPLIGAGQGDDEAMRRSYTPEELVQYTIDNGTPDFAPGEEGRWRYSNTGFILLGLVLEAATGEEYADLLQTRILDPLAMTETSFPNDVPAAGTIIQGYDFYPDGKNTTEWNLSQGWAAGGIISTAADLTTFLQALANGQLFEDPQTLLKMADFEESDGVVNSLGAKGYGIGLIEFADGVWGHGGQTLGFESELMFVPGTDISLVGLTNAAYGPALAIQGLVPTLQQLAGITPVAASEFPRPEPAYNAKRVRDFSAFEDALNAFTPARAAEMDTLLTGATVLYMQDLLDDGQTTSEELVTYYVNRIQLYDWNSLNSVVELNPNALRIARQLDQERAAGNGRGTMHGIPVLFKDNIATGDGLHATAGTYAMKDWQPDRDAFLVKQLRDAGAIILGKANLSEWANYMDPNMPSGFSALGGQTRNPYGPYEVWGSSSGSAVAAAAGFAAVTVGTETQGSIIMPAGINGVVAIKTSKGLVSGDYIIPLVDWMDVPGPIGRTVTDVAVLLTAMAGVDENDANIQDAAELAEIDFTQFLTSEAAEGLRVGVAILSDEGADQMIEDFQIPDEQADATKQALLAQNDVSRQIASVFAEQGMEIVEIDSLELPPRSDTGAALEFGFRDSLDRFLASVGEGAPVTSLADVIAINNEDPANRAPYGQAYLEGSQNTTMTQDEYDALVEANHSAAADGLSALFETYEIDVLLGDTQEYAPAGFPAITIPAGYDANGQPTPVVLVGAFLGEPQLLAAGYAFEQATQARQEPDLESTIQQIEQALGASTETSASADGNLHPVTQSPCIVPPGGDEIEGETIICGTVSVPEDYDDPAGNRIPLSYALLKASGDSPAPDPVIFLHGGPGSGELLTLATFVEDFATVRQDRDVVVFDQRGAGFSNTPLDCAMELISGEREITEVVAQAAPKDADKVKQGKILELCAQVAQGRGVDLAQYNTVNNARDVQSVVAALGYEEFNLYGHSYGTKLALETMRQQPAGLRSVIVDSVAPPDIQLYAHSSQPAVEAAQALFAACATDNDDANSCNAAYPDLEVRFNQLMAQIEESPITLDNDQSITPAAVVALFNMRNSRYNGPGISAYLPRMIAELEQGVTDTYIGLADGALLPPSPFDDEEFDPDEEASPPELTLAETFNFAANSMESLQVDPDVKIAYFALPQQPATQATMLEFIEQYIPAADSATLLETAQAMDDDDVAELYTLIRKFAAYQPYPVIATIIVPLHLFICNESIPFNTMEEARAYVESAPIPVMTQGALASAANSIKLCDGLPTGTVDDSFHDPVASDIPVLVMVGLNDTQTAASWGSVALETLSNGALATFPESGHGVYQFSQCAKDVGAAFFNQPDAAPDTACIEELKAEFVLP